MPTDETSAKPRAGEAAHNDANAKRPLSDAAERALAEAAARRAGTAHDSKRAEQPKELGGRGGLDPTRYGDWEINGLTSDF